MDFIPQAGIEYLGASCECCDAAVEMGLAIYVDEEADQQGDGWTYRRRVQCGPCHDFVAAREAIVAMGVWDEVCKLVWALRVHPGAFILETLQARKDEARQQKVERAAA